MRGTGILVCAAVLLGAPDRAHACGGFFCSGGGPTPPPIPPVQQAGETIVYGLEDDGTLTMAVRIDYQGAADDFAWITPVPAPPEVTLVDEALFDALVESTAARFTVGQRQEGTCRRLPVCVDASGSPPAWSSPGSGWSGGCGGPPALPSGPPVPYMPPPRRAIDASTSWDAGSIDAAGPTDAGVTVYSHGTIGPFDVAVLGAATAEEVVAWLRAHEYDIPESAIPTLMDYATAGHVFVALRLATQPTTTTLRPIMMRMATPEACLPIRLTAIATAPDLPITAFFLGDARVASRNYSAADLDLLNPGLWNGTIPWTTAIADAADREGGHAFVTEFAGPTPRIGIGLPAIADLASEHDPRTAVLELLDRGYELDAITAAMASAVTFGELPPEPDAAVDDAGTLDGAIDLDAGDADLDAAEPPGDAGELGDADAPDAGAGDVADAGDVELDAGELDAGVVEDVGPRPDPSPAPDLDAWIECLVGPSPTCPEPTLFDAARLIAALERDVRAPRQAAQDLIDRHPYLTRLSTTLSADEMTLDPIFVEDAGLPDVSRDHAASVVNECDDRHYLGQQPQRFEVGGRSVPFRAGIVANDSAYCSALGLYLQGTEPRPPAPPPEPPPRRSSSSGGWCGCGIARGGAWRAGILVLALALGLARRHARKS